MRSAVLTGVVLLGILLCAQAKADIEVPIPPPPVPDIGMSVGQYRVVYFQSDPLYVSQIPQGDNALYVRFSIVSGVCDVCDLTDAALWVYYYSGYYVYVLVGGLEMKGISGGTDAIDVEFGTFNYYYPVLHPFDSGRFTVGVVEGLFANYVTGNRLSYIDVVGESYVSDEKFFKLRIINPFETGETVPVTVTQIPPEGLPTSLCHSLQRVPGTYFFESNPFTIAEPDAVDDIYDAFPDLPMDIITGCEGDCIELSYTGYCGDILYIFLQAAKYQMGIEVDYQIRLGLNATDLAAAKAADKLTAANAKYFYVPDCTYLSLQGGPYKKIGIDFKIEESWDVTPNDRDKIEDFKTDKITYVTKIAGSENTVPLINIKILSESVEEGLKVVKYKKPSGEEKEIREFKNDDGTYRRRITEVIKGSHTFSFDKISDSDWAAISCWYFDSRTRENQKWVHLVGGTEYEEQVTGTEWSGLASGDNKFAIVFVKAIESRYNQANQRELTNRWTVLHEVGHLFGLGDTATPVNGAHNIMNHTFPNPDDIAKIYNNGTWNYSKGAFSADNEKTMKEHTVYKKEDD